LCGGIAAVVAVDWRSLISRMFKPVGELQPRAAGAHGNNSPSQPDWPGPAPVAAAAVVVAIPLPCLLASSAAGKWAHVPCATGFLRVKMLPLTCAAQPGPA